MNHRYDNVTEFMPDGSLTLFAGGANWNWDQVTIGHSATGEPDWSSGEGLEAQPDRRGTIATGPAGDFNARRSRGNR